MTVPKLSIVRSSKVIGNLDWRPAILLYELLLDGVRDPEVDDFDERFFLPFDDRENEDDDSGELWSMPELVLLFELR